MIELTAGDAVAAVSPAAGGRIASLTVGGRQLLVTGDSTDDPLRWGCYPMVPFAGRIRDGRFVHDGRRFELDINLPPNAIHGSGFLSQWEVLDHGFDHAELACSLTWPLGGTAHQHVQLTPDALVCVLTVAAGHESMPVTIGYHPWFVKPTADDLVFGSMYVRDDAGLPTGRLVEPAPRPWDDCFVEPRLPLTITVPAGRVGGSIRVTIASDCDHWVVYDQPSNATCVEPQSGPPDAVNLGIAQVLSPGEMLQRTMTIAWHSIPARPVLVTDG
jgi:aldose 1-epimerase